MRTFFLGTHQPEWLERTDVPLFISRRRLANRKRLPRARGPWALDSGGFSELSEHGRWTVTPRAYVAEVRRFRSEIGGLAWAAAQDWMCEPDIVVKTGLTVAEHQLRTVTNYEELLSLAPELPWVPVLQGWTHGDYCDHFDLYAERGHELRNLPLVGIGTVCRRQSTLRASVVVKWFADDGLRLHGFGFKTQGLQSVANALHSADSLAWSLNARMNRPNPECAHRRCSNCFQYAMDWRSELLGKLPASWSQAPVATDNIAGDVDSALPRHGGGSVGGEVEPPQVGQLSLNFQ